MGAVTKSGENAKGVEITLVRIVVPMELKRRRTWQVRTDTVTGVCRVGWLRTHLEEIDTTLAALFFGALHSLDAFPDGILNVCACELSWWRWAENTPLCGADDLLSDVGGE